MTDFTNMVSFQFGCTNIVKMDEPCSSKQQKITLPNYEKCIICQELRATALVSLPESSSNKTLLDWIEKHVEYHYSEIYMVAKHLQNETLESLELKNVT